MEGWLYDIEGNELYLKCDTVWYIRLKSLDGTRTTKMYPFRDGVEETHRKFMEWVNSFPDGCIVSGHNILSYDNFVMWKLFDIVFRVGKGGKDWIGGKHVQFVDTLYLSQYLQPDLQSHSLEFLAAGTENEKLPYRQMLIDVGALPADAPKGAEFKFYHPLLDEYCDGDVDANIGVLKRLWKKAQEYYKEAWVHPSYRMGQKSFYLMNAQEYTGVPFDRKLGEELKVRLAEDLEAIAKNVLPQLPPRPLKKGEEAEYRICAKPFKKDGSLSSNALKFIDKHKGLDKGDNTYEFYGKDYKLEGGKLLDVQLPMELKDQAAFKDWLLEQGWSPHFYNIKRGPDGKPERDPVTRKVIETSPKLQEAGKLCPSLEELDGPLVKEVVKYLSFKNRLGVLEGWCSNWRLDWDGCLPQVSTGITPTHRHKHSVIVNCPKAQDGVLYGKEFRSLFGVLDDEVQVGIDCAAGEARCEGHYSFRYDGGAYATELLSGDIHSKNAKAFYEEETKDIDITAEDFDKDSKVFKPLRSKSKNGKYALTFGASAGKLAKTLGKSEKQGKVLYDRFWEVNDALGKFKKAVENFFDTTGKKKFVPAIDGRLLTVRSKHSLVNLLFQSCLAILMEMVCCIFDAKMGELYLDELGRPYYLYKGEYIVRRRTFSHDELQVSCPPEVAGEIGQLVADAIEEAGAKLKIAVKMEGEYKVGRNWCETH